MKMKFLFQHLAPLFFILLSTINSSVYGQQYQEISGIVLDQETNSPLPGANIMLKGTITGTSSNQDGRFAIKTKLEFPVTIEISFLGYQTQTLTLTEPVPQLNIRLLSGIITIEEMVV